MRWLPALGRSAAREPRQCSQGTAHRTHGNNRPACRSIYVTGHRNPDTDSIASAIGYAELKGRLDPNNDYIPVRLGEVNPQTRWALEHSGAAEPEFLPHVMVRASDVMQAELPDHRRGRHRP